MGNLLLAIVCTKQIRNWLSLCTPHFLVWHKKFRAEYYTFLANVYRLHRQLNLYPRSAKHTVNRWQILFVSRDKTL